MTATPPITSATTSATVFSLRTQYPEGLIGVPAAPVRLTWRVRSEMPSDAQTAYEIQAAETPDFAPVLASSGVVPSSSALAVPAPATPTGSRQVRYYRVRIATADGWTAWSPTAVLETGLTAASDWTAVAVGIPSEVGGASPVVRTEFEIASPVKRARLYTTSLGLGDFALNGAPVSRDLLAPGWTSYDDRLLVTTTDVTDALVVGTNVLGAELADGWYRGRLGWEGRDAIYGANLAALAQLEIELDDGSTQVVASNSDWRGSFGAVTASGIYDGTDIDQTKAQDGWSTAGFDASAWSGVQEFPLDRGILDLPLTTGVREVATFPMEKVGPVFDAGQNVAGWVRLVVTGKRGDVVTVRHAEVLEPDGSLHTKSLRTARASDVYTLAADGETTLEPRFTFHGFRYADVVSTASVVSATAVAISSATSPRGSFESSDAVLNRLHRNVQWSQRDNFVSVPTDCPQRDERLGWTGDAQAFAMTASTLFDTESFWRSWLKDLELDQATDGGVASVVPNMLGEAAFEIEGQPQEIMGRAGWADAATIVPWSVYESTGSTEVLSQQLGSMRRWVGYLDARRVDGGLLPTDEFQYGDWLDPDAPGARPWEAKVSSHFVSNAFFAHSARILSRAERLVGDAANATRYADLGNEIAALTWAAYGEQARTTQSGCAIALEFEIAPSDQRAALGEELAALVRRSSGRIETGFLGTPLVLHALSKSGHLAEAYQMLLCRDVPSWLYQVEMGATTVWERWDALRPDGSIHPGDMDTGAGMLSFNHYAYGAVIDWVYRTLAGIAPTVDAPGYERAVVAPRPVAGVEFARASIETGFGDLSIDWKISDGDFVAELVVPFGVTAQVSLPVSDASVASVGGSGDGSGVSGDLTAVPGDASAVTGDASAVPGDLTLTHGTYALRVTHPLVVAHSS
ncbi:MAG: alpha-L-rhamnosidase [Actinomycetota bacterium]|nr:alpha-L-rhamnosidase [Actinomycetota bacterium]